MYRNGIDGVWRTDGYGTILSIDHGHLRGYETTAISCLPEFSAGQTGQTGQTNPAGPRGPGGEVAFTTDDHEVFRIRRDSASDRGHMRVDGSPGHRLLRRIAALPAECTKPTPTDPVTTFDVFWQTFAENYPFFAAKGIDWRQVRNTYRPQVNTATTGAQLLKIFDSMIAPLNDAHVGVIAGSQVLAHIRPGTTPPSPQYDQKIRTYIQRRDLKHAPQRFAQDRIEYADLPHHLGYLRISGFSGYTTTNDYASNATELTHALDTILTENRTETLRGLIIDLRVNGGGDDSLGLRIASRLTGRPYVAYAKRATNDPRDPSRFTTPQPITVRPAEAPIYRGPVALLTGGSTFSAGETFIQALMDREPAPIRIGDNTQGVFSDILERSLPNGWSFGLPNEEFLTGTGRTFDGTGIPPNIRIPVFTDEELAQNRDSAFDRAVTHLLH